MRPSPRRAASVTAAAGWVVVVSCTALPPPQKWIYPVVGESPPASHEQPRQQAEPQRIERLGWEEALDIAREHSPTIAAARERIGRAEALVSEAGSLAFPRLDLRGSYLKWFEVADFRGRTDPGDVSGPELRARSFLEPGSELYTTGVDLSYPLFDGGVAYYARRAAEASLDASTLEAKTVRKELDLRVFTAFLNVLLSEGAVRIAEETLSFTRGQEEQARSREEVGEGLKLDTLRFTTNASEEQLALNRARAERTIRLAVLSELLAVPLVQEVVLETPERDLEVPQGSVIDRALASRPELRVLDARILSARSALAREDASWWPTLDFFGSYGFISLDRLQLDSDSDEFRVGAALRWPLFEGGATVARSRALRHGLSELEAQKRSLVLQVEREVREARANLEVAARNVQVGEETVRLAERVLEQVSARYRSGEAQVLDVNEASLQRARSRLALLQSRVNLFLSQARLRRATGLPLGRGGSE